MIKVWSRSKQRYVLWILDVEKNVKKNIAIFNEELIKIEALDGRRAYRSTQCDE